MEQAGWLPIMNYETKVGRLTGVEKHEIIHFGWMDADSDYLIIKRKLRHEVWWSHRWKPDFISAFTKWLLHNGRSVQTILAASWASFSDCYVQSESIQMGALKAIKYSMFEVSALNEIVDGWIVRMSLTVLRIHPWRTTKASFILCLSICIPLTKCGA